jgi:hypothetical protein
MRAPLPRGRRCPLRTRTTRIRRCVRTLGSRGRSGSAVALPLAVAGGSRSEAQPGFGGHHRRPGACGWWRWSPRGRSLQVDRRGAEVGVAELPLDVQRYALAGEFERVSVTQLVWGESTLTPARTASRRNSVRTPAPDHGRPRVGPSMMQNSGPTGSSARAFSHGRSCSQAHSSSPTSRRRPPFPLRTRIDPRRWSRSCSANSSAYWMRRPARQRTTIIARTRQP